MTPSAVKAGNAFVEIGAIDKASVIFNTVGYNLFRFARNIENVGRSLMMLGVFTSLPPILSVKTYADFDNAMRRVRARTMGTAREFRNLIQLARDIGQETSISATRVAEMMGILGQKGFNRKQIQGSIGSLVDLSIGAGSGSPVDHEFAAKTLSGVLQAFKIDPSDTDAVRTVVDKLVAAVNGSNFSLEELSVTMSYAGAIANQFNLSLDETLALTAMLRNLNIEASSAGTALRNMLSELSEEKNRNKLNEMLSEAGAATLSMVDERGNLKDFVQIIFDLGESMKGLGTAQQGDIFTRLFGKRSLVPAMVISSGKNPFANILGAIQESKGLAAKTRKEMEGGIGGTIERVMGALDGLANIIGQILSPSLIDLGKKIEALLVDFTAWLDKNRELAYAIALTSISLVAFGGILVVVGITLKTFGLALGTIGGAMTAMALSLRVVQYPLIVLQGALVSIGSTILRLIPSFKTIGNAISISFSAAGKASQALSQGFLLLARGMYSMGTASKGVFSALFAVNSMSRAFLGVLISNSLFMAQVFATSGPLLLGIVAIASASMILFYVFKEIFDAVNLIKDASIVLGGRISRGLTSFFEALKVRVVNLFKDMQKSWTTIMAFLEMGDTASAWETALVAMRILWYNFLNFLLEGWYEIDRAFNLSSWADTLISMYELAGRVKQQFQEAAIWLMKSTGIISSEDDEWTQRYSQDVKNASQDLSDARQQQQANNTDTNAENVKEKLKLLERAKSRLKAHLDYLGGASSYINLVMDTTEDGSDPRQYIKDQIARNETFIKSQRNKLANLTFLADQERKQRDLEASRAKDKTENFSTPSTDFGSPPTRMPDVITPQKTIAEFRMLSTFAANTVETYKHALENMLRATETQDSLAEKQLKETVKSRLALEGILSEVKEKD